MTANFKESMKKLNPIITVTAFLLSATAVQAQHNESGYFTDGYLYRHEMNPALANEQNYVSMPALGNMDITLRGNIGIREILYNVNGRTALFTNPMVSTSEFLGNIHDSNRLGTDFKMQILGAGFKAFGGYNTIGISVRANEDTNIPGTLLSLAKEGLANRTYDVKDFRSHADAYAELSFGHSHQLNSHWRIGATLKVLFGGANVDAHFNKAELTFNGKDWTAVTNAIIESSMKGMTYKTETKERGPEGEKTPHTYVSGADIDGTGINGFGLAVDLGAEYKLNDDWKLSVALLDIGFISWSNNIVASTNGDRTFSLDKYTFSADKDADNSFKREADRLVEGVAALYELQNNGNTGGRSLGLGMTINAGAEYNLPVYRKISFGLLNTTRINGEYTWTDFRLSANWKAAKVFSMGVNFAAGTYDYGFGWIVNVHPNGFNLFLAMDRTVGKLAKQGVPLTSNASFTLGINFPF